MRISVLLACAAGLACACEKAATYELVPLSEEPSDAGAEPSGASAEPGDAAVEEPPPPTRPRPRPEDTEEPSPTFPRGAVDPAPTLTLASGPMLFYGGPGRVTVWLKETAESPHLGVAYGRRGTPFSDMTQVAVPPRPDGADSSSVVLPGFEANHEYEYLVFDRDQPRATPRQVIPAQPAEGRSFTATIAFVSCMDARINPVQPAWNTLLAERPNLLLQLGDEAYDGVNAARLRAAHMLQRAVPEYVNVLRQIPNLSIWDDHDFGGNDSNRNKPHKDRILATFRELFPNPSSGLPDTPGIFFSTKYGDLELFFVDNRYYRSPIHDPDDDQKEMLGEAQFRWLEDGIRASRATFKIIVSGTPLERGWTLYTRDISRLFFLTREVPGILMLSGDLHIAIAKAYAPGQLAPGGYTLHEIISSGIAVATRQRHFAVLHVDTTKPDPEIGVVIHHTDLDGNPLTHSELTIHRSELQ